MHAPGTIADRYVVHEQIGQGAMARVYRATDRLLGVERAIKALIVGHGTSSARLRARFQSEARTMASLAHPHLLEVYDMGSHEGQDYIVTALAEGSLLDAVRDDRCSVTDAVRWVIQVLSALAVAHDHGIVHRDIKPENILLDRNGNALLSDFGIALLRDDDRLTQTGVALGSMAFMAPEQRLDARRVGPAADLYSVGCMLYNLVTRRSPVDLFMVDRTSARLEHVPHCLRVLIIRSSRYDVEHRYPDARAMAVALVGALELLEGDDPPAQARTVDIERALTLLGPDFVTAVVTEPAEVARTPTDCPPEPAPHPLEDERMTALLELALLDTPPEERFDRHTRLALRLFDVPIALVSLVDEHRQWFKSKEGLSASETPRTDAFCAHAIHDRAILVVEDALLDERFRSNPLVRGAPFIRFYAGCPVRSPDGMPLGTLCVIDDRPRSLQQAELDLLRDLANMVEVELHKETLATIDAGSGLSNLDGFKRSANRVLGHARREGFDCTLILLKLVFLSSRHSEERAIESGPMGEFAAILREVFADALVLARVATDEFAVLFADDVSPVAYEAELRRRLHEGPLEAGLRVGSAVFNGSRRQTLAGLLGRSQLSLDPPDRVAQPGRAPTRAV